MHKILALFFLSIGTAFAASQADLSYVISNNEVLITDCDASATGNLAIPAMIEGLPVTGIYLRAFENCTQLTSVSIPASVASIDYIAFSGCSNLTSVVIAEGVTSVGRYAFARCISLESVTIPSSVISVGDSAFLDCDSLASILFEGVTAPTLGIDVFAGVPAQAAVTYPVGATGYNDTFGGLPANEASPFSYVITGGKVKITSCDNSVTGALEVPMTIEGAPVTSIGERAFYNCSSLTSLTLPDGVTSIGLEAFESCSALTSITLPDSVTSIGDTAFYNCISLTDITIPEGLTSIGGSTFESCSSLTSITIPGSVTSIGGSAFRYCSSLVNIVFEGATAPTLGDSVFLYVAAGATITYPFGATGYSNPFGGLPATAASADNWYSEASNLADGWRYFDWFKGFKPAGSDWIYHGRHGWLYVLADDTSGMFLWDVAIGRWMFTNETIYPWMYAYGSGGGWVFFFEGGSPGSRFFKRGDNAQTISERDLSVID